MTYSDTQLTEMVYQQTMKNLRKVFTKAHYNMMGEAFGAHKGFICQILYSDSSYYLTVRFSEAHHIMWMQLFLPVWIPHDKREQVAAFLNAYSAKRNWGRLDMDACGLVCALTYVELDGYRRTLKTLLKEMEGILEETGRDAQGAEKRLVAHCAPDAETLKETMSSLKSMLFKCEDEIVSIVYPGASLDGRGGSQLRNAVVHGIPNGGGDEPDDDPDDEDDPDEGDNDPDDEDAYDVEDISGLSAAFRRLLEDAIDGDDEDGPDGGDDASGGDGPDGGDSPNDESGGDGPAEGGDPAPGHTEGACAGNAGNTGKAPVHPRITGLPPED